MTSQTERRVATVAAILHAAKDLFARRGFSETSIDDIAARAGVAKGAVYHHFKSKEQIFERVFEDLSADLAARIPEAARAGKDLLDSIGRGTLKYLTSISSDEFRRILLIDGPAVLGWQKWREIDARYFGNLMQAPDATPQPTKVSAREVEALRHLIAGAITEAALVCAVSDNRQRTAKDLTAALQKMLASYIEAHDKKQ